jgi:alcohol dehydrogenase class IV
MVEKFKFSRLPEIHFGQGSFRKTVSLIKKFGNRILLVTGKTSFKNNQWSGDFLSDLDESAIKYEIISVPGEPVTSFIDRAVSDFREFVPDAVVSVGGGSAIDAGKALSAMIPVGGVAWDYLEGNPEQRPHPGNKVPFIAVPTTAGTGSEATKNAVLAKTGIPALKRSLRHDNFVPDIAVVDPELSKGCPAEVTAASGLDAITQLLEAYVSTNASAMSDALASSGLKTGFRSLQKAVDNGDDLDARSDMAYSSLLSGIALANAGLGAVHGFATVIGSYYSIPHGIICGTLLGTVTRYNILKLAGSVDSGGYIKKYAWAGKLLCAKERKSDEYYCMCLAGELERLTEVLNMPRLGIFGINESDIGKLAMETGTKNNPVSLSRSELESLLRSRL